MKYVLDTNSVSALLKGEPTSVAHLKNVKPSSVAVPQPVIAEIRFGLERLPNSKRKAHLSQRWALFERHLPRVTWTDEVSRTFGVIKATLQRGGNALEDFDIAIAAHALANDAILVTSDASHMSRIRGLKWEDWIRPRVL
jgi:tRNA(fMet)-specific endonuclease VapC